MLAYCHNFKSDNLNVLLRDTLEKSIKKSEIVTLLNEGHLTIWNDIYKNIILRIYAQLIEEDIFHYSFIEHTFQFEPIVLTANTNSPVLHTFCIPFIQKIAFKEPHFDIKKIEEKCVRKIKLPKVLKFENKPDNFHDDKSNKSLIPSNLMNILLGLFVVAAHGSYHYFHFLKTNGEDSDYIHKNLHNIFENLKIFPDNIISREVNQKLAHFIQCYVFGSSKKENKKSKISDFEIEKIVSSESESDDE